MNEFERICERIKQENELINHRLTWLGAFQGLLLASLAFAWDKSDAKMIIVVLGILGILVAISVGIGTCRANGSINNCNAEWDRIRPNEYSGLDIEGVRSQSGYFWWLMPGYFVPWAFAAAWIAILAINCTRQ